jgi:hypothetical protein
MSSSQGGARLKSASEDLFKAISTKAVGSVGDRLTGLTDKLEGVASGNPVAKAAVSSTSSAARGESPVKGALKGAASAVKDKVPGLGGGGGGGKGGAPKATKATNIIEQVDVGVPVRVAYNQWTEFGGFPTFMKKVENVEAEDDTKLNWKAQIFWSHRNWEATILEQVPDERIVWRSKGEKGHVDGAVTFHEIGPNLTRILVVLEYYPQGLFERTGNLWRAQGRRARVELKHFRRHVMTRTILDPDEVEGWRGTIEDGEVTQSHEEALEEEQQAQDEDQQDEGQQDEDQQDEGSDEESDEPEGEYDEDESDEDESDEGDEGSDEESDEPEDEYDEDESDEGDEESDEESDEEPEDEYDEDESDEDEDDEDEPEDEYDEDESEEEDEDEDEDEEEPEDEYDESDEPDESDESEDEAPEEDQEEPKPRRRRQRAS